MPPCSPAKRPACFPSRSASPPRPLEAGWLGAGAIGCDVSDFKGHIAWMSVFSPDELLAPAVVGLLGHLKLRAHVFHRSPLRERHLGVTQLVEDRIVTVFALASHVLALVVGARVLTFDPDRFEGGGRSMGLDGWASISGLVRRAQGRRGRAWVVLAEAAGLPRHAALPTPSTTPRISSTPRCTYTRAVSFGSECPRIRCVTASDAPLRRCARTGSPPCASRRARPACARARPCARSRQLRAGGRTRA
jgi:hypothetical protein